MHYLIPILFITHLGIHPCHDIPAKRVVGFAVELVVGPFPFVRVGLTCFGRKTTDTLGHKREPLPNRDFLVGYLGASLITLRRAEIHTRLRRAVTFLARLKNDTFMSFVHCAGDGLDARH